MISGGLDCEGCRQAFEDEGEDPPCEECGRPYNHPANALAWKVWFMCSNFERPPAMNGLPPIQATSVIQIVEAYGGDETDVDKVLRIERELHPVIAERGPSARD